MTYLKMYILVKDTVPLGLAITAVGHAAVACYRKFDHDNVMVRWLETSFRKVVCKVTEEEFERAKGFEEEHIVMTESALDGIETAIAFKPKDEWPKAFKYFSLYK